MYGQAVQQQREVASAQLTGAVGAPSPLAGEAAAQLLAVSRQIVEPLRAYGAYAAELPVGEEGDQVQALLAYLGRRADWAPER